MLTKLRAKRHEVGMSQVDLAHEARLSAPFVCDLEAGRRGARDDTWKRIAGVLHCDVEDIMERSKEHSDGEQ